MATAPLARLHANGSIETDDLTVEVLVFDREPDRVGELPGSAKPRRIGYGGREALLRLIG